MNVPSTNRSIATGSEQSRSADKPSPAASTLITGVELSAPRTWQISNRWACCPSKPIIFSDEAAGHLSSPITHTDFKDSYVRHFSPEGSVTTRNNHWDAVEISMFGFTAVLPPAVSAKVESMPLPASSTCPAWLALLGTVTLAAGLILKLAIPITLYLAKYLPFILAVPALPWVLIAAGGCILLVSYHRIIFNVLLHDAIVHVLSNERTTVVV